ncbi:MAG: hypothetical protein KAX49_13100 [Halanaerobiales bacterium]|nr:hypothetical protein [Halanaerobiales bacterium]
MKLKLYEVDFEPMYPVGGHLLIYATCLDEATIFAKETIRHTKEFSVEEKKLKKVS